MKILIPTFNNSKKLERSLTFYEEVNVLNKHEVYVLDGTTSSEANLNKNICENLNIGYRNYDLNSQKPIQGYFSRILNFFEEISIDEDEIICLVPDEDIVLPEYLDESYNFLFKNSDYSLFIGRYITFSKPFLNFHRIHSQRDTIVDLDINEEDAFSRLVNLKTALLS